MWDETQKSERIETSRDGSQMLCFVGIFCWVCEPTNSIIKLCGIAFLLTLLVSCVEISKWTLVGNGIKFGSLRKEFHTILSVLSVAIRLSWHCTSKFQWLYSRSSHLWEESLIALRTSSVVIRGNREILIIWDKSGRFERQFNGF